MTKEKLHASCPTNRNRRAQQTGKANLGWVKTAILRRFRRGDRRRLPLQVNTGMNRNSQTSIGHAAILTRIQYARYWYSGSDLRSRHRARSTQTHATKDTATPRHEVEWRHDPRDNINTLGRTTCRSARPPA